MDLNNKNQTILFTSIIGILVILSIIAAHHQKNNLKRRLNLNLKGAVEKVYYDDKGIPSVTVKGKKYDLIGTIVNQDNKIQQGDTIIKQSGDLRVKIIRPNSRDTIYERNPLYDPRYHKQY